jgi:hypothetical protein
LSAGCATAGSVDCGKERSPPLRNAFPSEASRAPRSVVRQRKLSNLPALDQVLLDNAANAVLIQKAVDASLREDLNHWGDSTRSKTAGLGDSKRLDIRMPR